ncbi:PP2C family protein-serine/threonine phosphatase [Actinomadura sp. K4S16]|uniref:PP2C family protein-serine/threonine phosphatase n=1 Tax=Actinomadura sp. K4S16 TaxID=1316147 RepID=UPI00190F1F1D|nr:PP2C family protein-serine/threonine phosphatase [Actinomadura sp. K4S16]
MPFAMMAIVAIVDVLAGPSVGYLPLLSLGPAFASLSASVRRTAAVGVLALTLCTVLGLYDRVLGTRSNNLTFASISGVIAASMLASAYRVRRERELADVRSVAEAAQRVLLRPVPRRVGPFRMAVRYVSASAQATIGGDLYEVAMTPEAVRVIVGDVQGKGLDAVETAAVVLGAFREAAYDEPDLPGVTARIEKALTRHLTSEQFVTAVLAELQDNGVILLNRGHPAPLLVRPDGVVRTLDPPVAAPPLGLGALVDEPDSVHCLTMAPEDQILFYTDGVVEARDSGGVFFPLLERAGVLAAPDPETALDELQDDLTRYVGGPIADDAAMLLLRRR